MIQGQALRNSITISQPIWGDLVEPRQACPSKRRSAIYASPPARLLMLCPPRRDSEMSELITAPPPPPKPPELVFTPEAIRQIDDAKNRLASRKAAFSDPTVLEIMKRVAWFHGVRLNDITSQRRNRFTVFARQHVEWLSRRHTERSLPEIGRVIGNRDHTTVFHGIRRFPIIVKAIKSKELNRSDYLNRDVYTRIKRKRTPAHG